jgi:hypothetical protein
MNRNDKPTSPPPPAEQTRQEMLEHADKLTALIQGLVAHRGWIIEMAERMPGGSIRS